MAYGDALQSAPAVPNSPDLQRVWALPRRTRPDRAPLPELRTPAGIAAGVGLKNEQTVGLNELHWARGLFGAFPVGIGKTHISYLAALCARKPNGERMRRPWMFLPANLARNKGNSVSKTTKEFRKLAQHWQQPQPFPLIHTYEELTQEKNLRMLDTGDPDMLIFDECSKLRRIDDGSAPIRIDRYVAKKRAQEIAQGTGFGSELQVVVLTGTIGRGSLADFAHMLRWCLGDNAPVPLQSGALWQWCQALDDDRSVGMSRWKPGALYSFAPEAKDVDDSDPFGTDALDLVRDGVAQRIADTLGVVMYSEDSCTQPISISFHVPAHCPTIEAFFKNYVRAWCTPDGYEYGDALSAYRNAGDAGCGFWGLWNPRAPEYWLNARREAMAVVKDAIDGSRKGHSPLDTEGAVFKAMPDDPAIVEWHKVRKDFIPNPEATWFTASLIYEVQALINQWEALGEKVIVWSFDTPVAQALTSVTGLPYYGAEGLRHTATLAKTDDSIEDDAKMRLPTDNPAAPWGAPRSSIICSTAANRYGRNLQYYAVNIWVGWNDASTIDIEQGFGRTHRQGQTRPVHNQIVITCGEALDAFAKAVGECNTVLRLQRHKQKLLQAEIRYDTIDRDRIGASPSRFAKRHFQFT
jgi:hypothetical protein